MLIEVNTEVLQKFGITADDFVYLYLLHAKSYDVVSTLCLTPNLEALQTKGLIKLGEELEDHTIRQAFLDMFQVPFDQMWSELLSHFPLRVNNQGNVRVLRARDANAKANSKAKRTYERYVGKDKTRHDYVVKCLKNELIHRKQSDSLGWMQMLQTWINNHTWEQYDSIENDKPTAAKTRITRKL